ncbi:MAG TPA: hypothetical protein RMH80_07160 [Polyangiaceae bacterium LLY-WYZ-15_(1-7)]|nr:hypothetical protein [Polyangiaceae bacterium LLY-WYZ-15_(1-7)]
MHAGLDFELLRPSPRGDARSGARLEGRLAKSVLHGSSAEGRAPSAARIFCSLHRTRAHGPQGGAPVRVRWKGDVARAEAGSTRARLRLLSGGALAASVEAPTDEQAVEVVTAAALERVGGFLVHASGVLEGGEVMLFVGPSGAGKSTAVELSGKRFFTVDRAALVPVGDRWWAWRVPGGKPDEWERLEEGSCGAPLRGVYRVVHGEPGFEAAGGAEALTILRQACYGQPGGPEEELERLARLEGLARAIEVGRVRTRLGAPLELRGSA